MCSYPEGTFFSSQTFGTEEGSGALVGVVEMVLGVTVVAVVVVVVVVVVGVLKVPGGVGCVVKAGCKGGRVKGPSGDPELSITTSVTFGTKHL